MKMSEEGVELLLLGIMSDMGMGTTVPVGCARDAKRHSDGEICEDDELEHDIDFLRVTLLGVEKIDVRETYERQRRFLRHPVFRNAPLDIVGRQIGCR